MGPNNHIIIDDTSCRHPASHAGHQIHHTATCVHMPQTFHPKAASLKIVSTGVFNAVQMPNRMAGGEITFRASSPVRDLNMGRDTGLDPSLLDTLGPALLSRVSPFL